MKPEGRAITCWTWALDITGNIATLVITECSWMPITC